MNNKKKLILVLLAVMFFGQCRFGMADVVVSKREPQFLKKEGLKDFNKNNGVHVGIDNPFEKIGKVELIYLDELAKVLRFLPTNGHKTRYTTFSCDEDGRYFAINTDLGNFLVDAESGSVVFEMLPPYTQKVIYVSPHAKYFVLATENDGINFTDFYDISSKQKVFTADGDLMVEFFMGTDDQYVFGDYKGRSGLIDLNSPNNFFQVSSENIPSPGQFYSTGPNQIFGYSEKLDKMVIWNLPTMSVEEEFGSLPRGTPFSNKSGTVVGSFDENQVYFCDVDNKKVLGFAFSNLDQNLFLEMVPGKRKVKTIKGGIVGWETFDTFEIAKILDLVKQTTKEFSPTNEGDQIITEKHITRNEGNGNYFVVTGVDPDESGEGFYVRFTLWAEGKNAKPPCSQVAHFDSNLQLDKVSQFSTPIYPNYKLDQTSGSILGTDREGRHFKFDLK